MRNKLLTLFTLFITSFVFGEIIEANVIFDNKTKKNLTSAKLIIDSNQIIQINSLNSFKIKLSDTENHNFNFISDKFSATISYPSKLTKENNTITIHLTNKPEVVSLLSSNSKLTDKQLEEKISAENISFVIFGLDNSIPKEYKNLQEKYGIGLEIRNCAVDPLLMKKVTDNNQIISDYLNKKYGTEWINELKIKPFGIE